MDWLFGALAMLASTLLSSGSSVYSANKQAKATIKAAEMQRESAEKALSQQYEEMNRQNQKEADLESILEQNTNGDDSATMLTGAMGVSQDKLRLGKGSNLLGG